MLLMASFAFGQDSKGTAVVIKEGMTMRDISKQYLGNPDLWEDILRANSLKSIGDVKPGMTIYIPVQAITGATKSIDQAAAMIQEATKTGARIFAGEQITKAIQLRDSAIEKRKVGAWAECAKLGTAATAEAKKALDLSLANKNVPAEAALAFKKGDVEKRKAVENAWKPLALHGTLIEEERVRTLTESYAEILFRDDSRIRLNANSQALIKKMRANLVENSDEASVSLIEGEVMALLAGGKKAGSFKLEVPNVETKINSGRFWVGRNDESAKFANFNGELEVSAGGGKVTIKENQGSIVPNGQKPTPPKELLPAPALLSPEADIELFDLKQELNWGSVQGASNYRLEIATENGFTRMVSSRDSKANKLALHEELADGLYYWRATAVSKEGLPGNPSNSRIFRFVTDNSPPFLIVTYPAEGEVFTSNSVTVKGSVESKAALTTGSEPIQTTVEGEFNYTWKLSPGKNSITFKAVDRAGNVTEVKRTVEFLADEKIPLKLNLDMPKNSKGEYLIRSNGFLVTGETTPKAEIFSSSVLGQVSTGAIAKETGRFELILNLTIPADEFVIKAVSPTGLETSTSVKFAIDNVPPKLNLDEFPTSTNQIQIAISGLVTDGILFERNGIGISLSDGKFSDTISLKPGENVLRWTAFDELDNRVDEERTVFLDSDAPKFVKSSFTPATAVGGESIALHVWASDASLLRKAAPFSLEIGTFKFSDNLLLTDPYKGLYTTTVKAPLNAKGPVKLTTLKLSDQLGNTRDYPPWDQR